MIACPACSSHAQETQSFCSSCGTSLRDDLRELPTLVAARERTQAPTRPKHVTRSSPHSSLSSSSSGGGRFVPGIVLAERYRIIGLLGKGGMGEVYRADDLTLGQSVALKFLPEAVGQSADRLERFYAEVRIARQISHPAVCRVYDVSQIDGSPMLSMEYVDGEDLSSLLRRIGRLPRDKGVEIARQICSGLAAAHDKGVLHRDLKPSNIMLDGRGKVRITDFGLASAVEDLRADDIAVGTPAYMAPEQLSGRSVSVRSDIYALGLVLYELFTGRPPFEASSVTELSRKQTQTTPISLTSVVADMDEMVERAVLRCLEPDPGERPPSALAVLAALPGGDPLAAALAAGETPSPDMVAALGSRSGMKPLHALGAMAGVILAILAVVPIGSRAQLTSLVPMAKSPEVLAERSREVLAELGYAEPPGDSYWGLARHQVYLEWIRDNDSSLTRWERLAAGQPAAVHFWYRQGPRELIPWSQTGEVSYDDPPQTASNMARLALDTKGRLMSLEVSPPQKPSEPLTDPREPEWPKLFALAGLDYAKFTSAPPEWVPPVFSDRRAAWTGQYPDQPDIPVRVEAASFAGRVVFMSMLGQWSRPFRDQPRDLRTSQRVTQWISMVIIMVILAGAAFLARHHIKVGRGDRRGAARLGLFVSTCLMLSWVLSASHVADRNAEWVSFVRVSGIALFLGGVGWMLYLSLEPYVRRHWPQSLVTWTRLLSGDVRDPRVGRDVLLGGLCGSALTVVDYAFRRLPGWLGWPPSMPGLPSDDLLMGGRQVLAYPFGQVINSLINPILMLFLLLLMRAVLRRAWLVSAVFVGAAVTLALLSPENPGLQAILALCWSSALLLILMRLGLLALVATYFFYAFLVNLPFTMSPSAWYASTFFSSVLLLLVVTGAALWISLAGQRLLAGALND